MHWMAAGCVTVVGVEDGSVKLSFGRRGVGGLFTILVTDWISWHRLLRDAAARLQVRMPKWALEYFTSYEMETLSYLCQMSLQMAVQLDSALHSDFIYRLQTRVSVDRSAINCRAWTELVHGVLRQGHNAVAWGKLVRRIQKKMLLTGRVTERSRRTWFLLGRLSECIWEAPGTLGNAWPRIAETNCSQAAAKGYIFASIGDQ
jgi:hypothetical protein